MTTTHEASAQVASGELPSEAVARRAYQIFLARGGGEDRQLDDWLQAEPELMRQGQAGELVRAVFARPLALVAAGYEGPMTSV